MIRPIHPMLTTTLSKIRGSSYVFLSSLQLHLFKAFPKMTNRPLVFCGPSGSGKSTLVNMMMKEFPDKFGFSVSHTTRKPRPGEVHTEHYHFIIKEEMEKEIAEGKFIETACFSGNLYGTSWEAVQAVANAGKVCVLDIDVQGVKQIKKTSLNPWFIFVEPPSLEELESRLRGRNTESEESLQQRLSVAQQELAYGKTPGMFDLVITNDNLEHAYSTLKDFLSKHVLNHYSGDVVSMKVQQAVE